MMSFGIGSQFNNPRLLDRKPVLWNGASALARQTRTALGTLGLGDRNDVTVLQVAHSRHTLSITASCLETISPLFLVEQRPYCDVKSFVTIVQAVA
jgi:hypothetical protein